MTTTRVPGRPRSIPTEHFDTVLKLYAAGEEYRRIAKQLANRLRKKGKALSRSVWSLDRVRTNFGKRTNCRTFVLRFRLGVAVQGDRRCLALTRLGVVATLLALKTATYGAVSYLLSLSSTMGTFRTTHQQGGCSDVYVLESNRLTLSAGTSSSCVHC